jgi:FlaA1/EpsC-like NDP-sugar epimerase
MRKMSGFMKISGAIIAGAVVSAAVILKIKNKIINQEINKTNKFRGYYDLTNKWISIKNEGKSLSQYFKDQNYKKICIYGMGELGIRLLEELKDSEIEVAFAIDKNAGSTNAEIDIYDNEEISDEFLNDIDIIVVTAIFAFDEIEEQLREKISCPVISLEDVVFSL